MTLLIGATGPIAHDNRSETLEGPHTRRAALKSALRTFAAEIERATSRAELDLLVSRNGPLIKQCKQYYAYWWAGDPAVPEDIGLEASIIVKRSDLSPEYFAFVDALLVCEDHDELTKLLDSEEFAAMSERQQRALRAIGEEQSEHLAANLLP